MSPERARKGKTMKQTTFGQRIEVYSVKKIVGTRVSVRAEGKTSIGRMSIFFDMLCVGDVPRVGDDILVSITTPADSAPSASE